MKCSLTSLHPHILTANFYYSKPHFRYYFLQEASLLSTLKRLNATSWASQITIRLQNYTKNIVIPCFKYIYLCVPPTSLQYILLERQVYVHSVHLWDAWKQALNKYMWMNGWIDHKVTSLLPRSVVSRDQNPQTLQKTEWILWGLMGGMGKGQRKSGIV